MACLQRNLGGDRMRSLNARITLSAAVVLTAFVILSAFTLDKTFRDSARNAREERLLAQIYLLMAAAEVDNDGVLKIANRATEPRLDLPDSGLYASIVDGGGSTVWQSRSSLSVDLPATPTLAAGEQTFSRASRDARRYLQKSYGIDWSTGTSSHPFTFNVIEDSAAYDEQLGLYRRSLWTWLATMAVLLLISQWAALRWGLAPLRKVSDELNRLEQGEQQQIAGRYPSEVQRLADNLNAVLSHERKQQQRYRDALADLAHSLKTPLAVVRGAAREHGSNAGQTIEDQIEQMDRIVQYHLQRAAASGRKMLGTPVALRPATERIVAAVRKVYRDKLLDVVVDIADDLRFRGDEGDLTEVLGNLVDNACKWCRGTIRISASDNNGYLRLRFEDDGPGIGDGDIARVFGRGARADESVPGHGIGLSVVREIVHAYGGEVQIATSKLGGALIEVEIPAN